MGKYWTLDRVTRSASKYKYRKEWETNDRNAYKAWLRMGRPSSVASHMKLANGMWNIKSITESALKYKTIRDWRKNESGAYAKWHTLGCPEGVTDHMIILLEKNKWDIDSIKKSALKYNTRGEWMRGCSRAYNVWLSIGKPEEIVEHMDLLYVRDKWNSDTILKSALKYSTISDWVESESGAYNAWIKMGKNDSTISHMVKRKQENNKQIVYSYIFSDNSVYVGITSNEQKRRETHLNGSGYSAVYDHILKLGEHPIKYNILEDFNIHKDAKILEGMWCEEYLNMGYTLLNRTGTGDFSMKEQ